MNKYRVVRIPIPRSRLDNPSVRLLARKLLFKLRHPQFVPSPSVTQALGELRNVLSEVLIESEHAN